MTGLQNGLEYGTYTQGVTVSQTNFTSCNYGIGTLGGSVNLLELCISTCQFGCFYTAISLGVALNITLITNNLFLINNGGVGIQLNTCYGLSVVGNAFQSNASAGGFGIVVASTQSGVGGVVTGNAFTGGLGKAIWLQSASSGINVQSNFYHGNTLNVQNDAGVANSVGGGSA